MRLNTSRLFRLTIVTLVVSKTTGFNVQPVASSRRQQRFPLPFEILSATTSPEFDIGLENIPGVDWKRPAKVNQDAWIQDETDDFVIVGVLDGHGKLGHEVSSYFASTLPSEIKQRLQEAYPNRIPVFELEERLKSVPELPQESDLSDDVLSLALTDSFHAVHWKAMLDPDQKPGRSGATCITCLINKKTKECHVAYVGDSKAILIGSGKEGSIQIVAERTTVNVPEERKRIESGEGSIRGSNVFYGPVGIAMTRALGDTVMLRAGVIPTPIVETFKLQDCDTLVLATDGIWDVLQDQEVSDTINDSFSGGAQGMAATLATIARKKWAGDLPIMDEVKADDITVLVLTCTDHQ
ncbi:unnamed protein product [Cylindrotheca closterium]|uniref:PPM-type phosphatase domain-containing protein n=1 Tax=Cylindrotheca closterium TaxID=2856 RepID=A0AAD2JMI1_9STRA|nr:unnamed protein product [Cylindrotheca closterium]